MIFLLALAIPWIVVHDPDTREVELNANLISSLREPRENDERFGTNVNCIVFMTNGKFIGTIETCDQIIKDIKELPQ